MTNKEIRAAILRIVQIKSLQEEEAMLRLKVIKEIKRRRKEKLDLGGPKKEDYVCYRTNAVNEIPSAEFLTWLEDRAVDSGGSKEMALRTFVQCVTVTKNKCRSIIGTAEVDRLDDAIGKFKYYQERLTYKISTDDKNQVRGIDL
jgi:hypothetical protein